jgi:complement component 1 Q subcomponent-binding protein
VDDNEKNDSESSIPLVVNIFKGNGVCLEFGVTAFSDEVSIDSLSIKKPDESEDELVYEGPEFT